MNFFISYINLDDLVHLNSSSLSHKCKLIFIVIINRIYIAKLTHHVNFFARRKKRLRDLRERRGTDNTHIQLTELISTNVIN